MVLNEQQYRILEGLAALGKVSAKTYEDEKDKAYHQNMMGQFELLASQADKMEVPFSIQNLSYFFGQQYPTEHNSQTIERALKTMYDNAVLIRCGKTYCIENGMIKEIEINMESGYLT